MLVRRRLTWISVKTQTFVFSNTYLMLRYSSCDRCTYAVRIWKKKYSCHFLFRFSVQNTAGPTFEGYSIFWNWKERWLLTRGFINTDLYNMWIWFGEMSPRGPILQKKIQIHVKNTFSVFNEICQCHHQFYDLVLSNSFICAWSRLPRVKRRKELLDASG